MAWPWYDLHFILISCEETSAQTFYSREANLVPRLQLLSVLVNLATGPRLQVSVTF